MLDKIEKIILFQNSQNDVPCVLSHIISNETEKVSEECTKSAYRQYSASQ